MIEIYSHNLLGPGLQLHHRQVLLQLPGLQLLGLLLLKCLRIRRMDKLVKSCRLKVRIRKKESLNYQE